MHKCTRVLRAPVLGLGVISFLAACDPIPSKVLTPEQKKMDMEWIYSQFNENYAPLEYKLKKYGAEASEVYQLMKDNYIDRAMNTQSNEEFYQLMHQFVAEFHDAHTTAALTHGNFKNRAKIAYLGFSGRRQGNRFLVTEFLPTFDVSSSPFPLRVGDEISMMDGRDLPTIIKEDLVRFRDIGHEPANLTFHMNRIFNRVSTSLVMPTSQDATLTIVRREYTTEERKKIEETRSLLPGEKKEVNLTIKLPWIVKDLYQFKKDQSEAQSAEAQTEMELERDHGASSKYSMADLFTLPGGEGRAGLVLGFKGFDGTIQFPSQLLSRMTRGTGDFNYLNTFYFPDQVESWTAQIALNESGELVAKAESAKSQLMDTRYIPQGAVWITPDNATFPAYVSEEGPEGNRFKVATLYLHTFSPGGKEDQVMKEITATLKTLQFWGVHKLIIDLVNNGGGSISLGMKIAQALSNEQVEMPKMQFVLSQTWLNEFEEAAENAPTDSEKKLAQDIFEQLERELKEGKRLSTPVSAETLAPFDLQQYTEVTTKPYQIVLLVNEMCASMCDIFTGILKDNSLATVIGTKTMGAGGNVVAHYSAPNSHLVLRQTESLIIRSNGEYIENNGIDPDIEVDVNRDVSSKYRNLRRAAIQELSPRARRMSKRAISARAMENRDEPVSKRKRGSES